MSLQVWLPLNGDLHNQGLLNWQPTLDSGTTASYETGKMGQALCTGAITMPASITSQVLNNDAFSYTCWIYVKGETGSTSQRAMIFGNNEMSSLGGRQFSLFQYSTCNDLHWSWQNYTGGTYSSAYGGVLSGVLPSNTWTHIAVTYNKPNVKIYINNEVKYSGTWTSNADSFNYDTKLIWNSSYHLLNDIRLYNHGLSAKEVDEISRGLILHYKLDNNGTGRVNNIKQSTIVNRSCSSFTYDSTTKEWTLVCPVNSSTWGVGFYINDRNIIWQTGETWIISFEVYTPQAINWQRDINNKPDLADISSYTGNDYDLTGQRYTYTNGVSSQTLLPGWNKIWFSQTAPTSYGLSNYSTNWGVVTSALTDPITIKIRNIKGEVVTAGDTIKPTTYIPNEVESEYLTKIYDSSGYGHNASVIGTLSMISNSRRYNCASYMNNVSTSNHIEADTAIPLLTDHLTASFWMKASKSSAHVIFAHPNFEFGTLNSLGYVTLTTGAGFTLNNFINNEWNHIVVIRNDTTYKLYVNGVAETRNGANNYYIHNGDKMWLLNRNYNNVYGANATISDFRIYVTELTEAQIKELYNTSITIDNQGNSYARELVE